MLKWLPYPFLRASGVFTLGVITGLNFKLPWTLVWVLWLSAVVIFLFLALKPRTPEFRTWSPLIGVLALIAVLVAGYLRSGWDPYKKQSQIGKAHFYQAQVIGPVQLYSKYRRTLVAGQWMIIDGTILPIDNNMYWYQGLDKKNNFKYGDQVIIKGAPRPVKGPSNPHEFDYANYLSHHNIFWQHWISPDSIIHTTPFKGVAIRQIAFDLQHQLQQQIDSNLTRQVSREIAGAMLLGNRDRVSDELEQAFAASGTLHILAVSGLHLGILYWALLHTLGRWRFHPWFKWIFILICLFVLWSFALITGLAPSTQRAAIMFSLLMVGQAIRRKGTSYNALALSAMVILMVNPYQIFAVGFQLSYAALAGILYLQPRISRWFKVQNRLLKYFWSLISVTLSAQIAVLPLSIYYFHQIPVYFLISNLLLVPLAFMILLTGVLFFICGALPWLLPIVSQLLDWLTQWAGFLTKFTAALPASTLDGLWTGPLELLASYATLLLFILFCQLRKRTQLQAMLIIWMLFISLQAQRQWKTRNQRLMVFYQVPGHTAVDFMLGHGHQSLMDSSLVADQGKIRYHLGGFRQSRGVSQSPDPAIAIRRMGSFALCMFQERLVLLINAPVKIKIAGNTKLKSNIVVLSNNSVTSVTDLTKWLDMEHLIIDGSNHASLARKLAKEALQMGLAAQDLGTQGAMIINL